LGLTSPVGTTEGKFLIRRDAATGKKTVVGNPQQEKMLSLFAGKSPSPDATTAPIMDYDEFIAVVRDLVQRQ
jgi:hypothetical protein